MRFSDPDEAARAIQAVDVELSIHSRSTAKWWMSELMLGDASVVKTQFGAPMSASSAIRPDTLWYVLPRGPATWTINRQHLGRQNVASFSEATTCTSSTDLPAKWIGIAVSREALDREAQARDSALRIPTGFAVFRPAPLARERLRNTIASVQRFVRGHGGQAEDPQVLLRLQHSLLGALVGALGRAHRPPRAPSPAIAYRVADFLEAHRDQPVSTMDLCHALSVGERQLRRIFTSIHGVSPGRYLRIRRLHQVRRALRASRFGNVTLAGVHFGFFDLGRMAMDYRELFGERPSDTLRQSGAP
jgi:AraC family ethanolamine operon transcriptional activator